MPQIQCDEAVFPALSRLFSLGVARNCDYTDLEELLAALRVLSRDPHRLDLADAQFHIRRMDWIGALRLLCDMDARGDGSPVCTALQAWCLHTLQDPEWRRHVSSILWDSNDATALAIAARFLNVNRPSGTAGDPRADIAAALQDATHFS